MPPAPASLPSIRGVLTRVDLRIGQQLFIAVAYAECLSRPVRIQPTGVAAKTLAANTLGFVTAT